MKIHICKRQRRSSASSRARGPVWMCGEQLLEMIAPDEAAAKAMAETASSDAEKERLTEEVEALRKSLPCPTRT